MITIKRKSPEKEIKKYLISSEYGVDILDRAKKYFYSKNFEILYLQYPGVKRVKFFNYIDLGIKNSIKDLKTKTEEDVSKEVEGELYKIIASSIINFEEIYNIGSNVERLSDGIQKLVKLATKPKMSLDILGQINQATPTQDNLPLGLSEYNKMVFFNNHQNIYN